MRGDIYDEAVADAKKLREKTTQVVEQRLLEKFRPKIDRYIEQALLEADDDDEGDDILLGVDVTDAAAEPSDVGDDIARDVEASIEGAEGEEAALQINKDGTVTLDMDKLVVPEEPAVEPMAAPAADAAAAAAPTGDVAEALTKLDALRVIAEGIKGTDAAAAFERLTRAYDGVFGMFAPRGVPEGKQQVFALTELAERINAAYTHVRESGDIADATKVGLLGGLEATYARVNDALAEAVCRRLDARIGRVEAAVTATRNLSEAVVAGRKRTLYSEVDALCRVLEAVADRTDARRVGRLRDRIEAVVEGIRNMTRKRLNEEEVVIKIELPDADAKAAVVAALGADDGSGEGSDDELDALLGDDMGDMGDGDDLELESDDASMDDDVKSEASASRDLARLFEDDDKDDAEMLFGDDDAGDDMDADADADADAGDDDTSDAAASLDRVADILRDVEGDVDVELVDDVAGGGDDLEIDIGEEPMDLDDAGLDIDIEESDDVYEAEDCGPKDDEMLEVDMNEVAAALKEMDDRYHKQDLPGPDGGIADFGGATETSEPFADEELAEARRARRARLRGQNRVTEGRSPSATSAREVALMRRKLDEAKRKQQDSNLLSAKLLYTNKLLQRSDLNAEQRTRIVDAMDEARNLREARLLYKNLTRAFEKRRGRLSEGRHRPVGSASQVTTSGGFNRTAGAHNEQSVLNESIDLELWKRHAGLD